VSQHREIVGYLLHARAIRLADLGHDFADLRGEGFRCRCRSRYRELAGATPQHQLEKPS
jgi:hypothetical protein